MTTSEWASVAATRFVEQEGQESAKWIVVQQRHRALQEQAPKLWDSIRQALKARLGIFNDCVGREVLTAYLGGDKRFTLNARMETGRRGLCADFDTSRYAITCSAYTKDGRVDFDRRYAMILNDQNHAVITAPSRGEMGPDDVSEQLLNGLLGWK